MFDPSSAGPKRTGRSVPPTPATIPPEEVARMTGMLDRLEHPAAPRPATSRGVPAMALTSAMSDPSDPFRPPVRGHLVAMEKLLRKVERVTYQRMYTIFDDWVDLLNIMLDQLPAHLREAVETGRISDWPAGTPPERIATFERIKARYGAKAPEAFTLFSHAAGAFLEATHSCWFDWLGQLYMALDLGGRGIGDYYTPWAVASMMAQIQDIPGLLHQRLMQALTHEENAMGAAVGITSMLFRSGPDGEPPVMGEDELNSYFVRWVIPAAAPFFEPITVMDPAVGSGVMLLAAASTVPLWARRYSFVQFFGMDISHIAVQMCRAQTRAYGLNGWEAAMVQVLEEAGWDKFRLRMQAAHERAEAEGAVTHGNAASAPPAFKVIPREVTGHVAHPTLRRRAMEQPAPTVRLQRPSAAETAKILASRTGR